MAASTAHKLQNHINPEVLSWARRWRGLSIEDVAEKFKKDPEQIRDWEEANSSPTVKQARKLAELYRRNFMEFFLPTPPSIPDQVEIPDFRAHKELLSADKSRELDLIIQWAVTQRNSALELMEELDLEIQEFPDAIFRDTNKSPENTATKVREFLDFSADDQLNIKANEAYKLLAILRGKFEQAGILTLKDSNLKAYGVRGFCIAEFPLPTIVIGKESPTGLAFTLSHELGHIVLKASGISGPRGKDYRKIPEERWCDRFAAAFLMPKEMVVQEFGGQPEKPQASISDEALSEIANRFRVSPHAMLVRLVHLNIIESNFYWAIKKQEFDELEANYKSFGRAPYYGTRYVSQNGSLFTNLVVDAWSSGRISNHNAAEYLGIKNLRHLYDIRSNREAV